MYCYNVWKHCKDYPRGTASLDDIKRMIIKLKQETKVKYISLSGGEPLLRKDVPEIIGFIRENDIACNLITNGTLLNEQNIPNLIDVGVGLFELPLLSSKRDVQDHLMRACTHEKVIESISLIREHGGRVVPAIVGTKINLPDLRETIELAFALGVEGIMFNRFNPGGEGLNFINELLPSVEELRTSLDTLNNAAEEYNLFVSSQIPIPPCLIDMSKYPRIKHGYCPLGNNDSYFTIDPIGNVRMCNHSEKIIGNLYSGSISEIQKSGILENYINIYSKTCAECKDKLTCKGSCKACGEACFGTLDKADVFVEANLDKIH